MAAITRRITVRRAFLALAPAAIAARLLPAQLPNPHETDPNFDTSGGVHLPNGKLQHDEILKADYARNLKDARDLSELTRSFELDLEKSDRFVLSLSLLKKLDDIEKTAKRIRSRMRK